MKGDRIRALQELVCKANIDLFNHGLIKFSFGNVSGIDRREGIVAIKPSGVGYDRLTPDKIVVLSPDGEIICGDLRPSSDTPTHLELYRNFPGIGGVAHTHSTYATGWAQAGREIPCMGTTHADYSRHGVPCTKPLARAAVEGPYEKETGKAILRVFRTIPYDETPMVLVNGHGPFTWGASAAEAVEHSVILEEIAKTAFMALSLSPGKKPLSRYLADKHFFRKHGKNAYYGQVQQ